MLSIDTTENSRDNIQEYIINQDPSELFIYNFDSILIAMNNINTATITDKDMNEVINL